MAIPSPQESVVLPLLKRVRRMGAQWLASCPAHDDDHRSLAVRPGRTGLLLHCHAGCSFNDIIEALGLDKSALFTAQKERRPMPPPTAIYRYTDATGNLLYEVLRMPGKEFRHRRPGATEGTYEWDMKGVTPVPYRLPSVVTAIGAHKPVFICEGEKDATNLAIIGLCGTCNNGGAGKWPEALNKHFKGADVVILPDNDEAGYAHAGTVATNLMPLAHSIVVVPLPGLPHKGDVSDWLLREEQEDAPPRQRAMRLWHLVKRARAEQLKTPQPSCSLAAIEGELVRALGAVRTAAVPMETTLRIVREAASALAGIGTYTLENGETE